MKKYTVIILFIFLFFFCINFKVSAANAYTPPDSCNGHNPPLAEDLTVDSNCQLKKIQDPRTICQIVICKEDAMAGRVEDPPLIYNELINFFGDQSIYIRSDKQVAGLINLIVSSFLAITSVFAIIYGVYVGGVKRAQTTNEEEIVQYNRTLVTLIVGFIIAWGFIFIMQIVVNLLGLGSLNDLVILSDPDHLEDGSVIVIK